MKYTVTNNSKNPRLVRVVGGQPKRLEQGRSAVLDVPDADAIAIRRANSRGDGLSIDTDDPQGLEVLARAALRVHRAPGFALLGRRGPVPIEEEQDVEPMTEARQLAVRQASMSWPDFRAEATRLLGDRLPKNAGKDQILEMLRA